MPIALRDTEMDVAQVIESATITGINFASGSLFAGPMPDVGAPDQVVACRLASGTADHYVGKDSGLFTAEVQVMVRGNAGEYAATHQLARTCFEAVWNPVAVGIDQMLPEGVAANYLGPDENHRPVFTFIVNVTFSAEKNVAPFVLPIGFGLLY